METTRTTTQLSGLNSAASQWQQEEKFGDPYLPICQELHRLLSRKRGYYGCKPEEPLANAKAVAEEGIDPVMYQAARINEKLRRLRGLNRTFSSSEKIRETLIDIAGHAAVAIALIDEKKTSCNNALPQDILAVQ